MNVLLATSQYMTLSGTETLVFTVAKELQRKGVNVTIYSPFVAGPLKYQAKLSHIRVINDINLLKDSNFQVIHCFHNFVAIIMRYFFPNLPIVYGMNGPLPFLEQPPSFINFNYYLGISQEIVGKLTNFSISKDKIIYFPNSIDLLKFRPNNALPNKPKNLLVLTQRFNKAGYQVIYQAAKKMDLDVKVISFNKTIFNHERHIQKADIVIALGRGAIESMACGKAVIVFASNDDIYSGGDGMITNYNIERSDKHNFSGRAYQLPFNLVNLISEIKKYDSQMGKVNFDYVQRHFNIEKNIEILLDVYKNAIKEQVLSFENDTVNYIGKIVENILSLQNMYYYKQNLLPQVLYKIKTLIQ